MFDPSTAARGVGIEEAERGGRTRSGGACDWSVPALIKPPPPPLTGQRMCGCLFRLRVAGAFKGVASKSDTAAEHTKRRK